MLMMIFLNSIPAMLSIIICILTMRTRNAMRCSISVAVLRVFGKGGSFHPNLVRSRVTTRRSRVLSNHLALGF